MHESHADERAFHDEAISRLRAEHRRLQNRIDAMHLDKLASRLDLAFYDSKSAERRAIHAEASRVAPSLEVAERSQEQIDLPENHGVPLRAIAAIEKPVPLTLSGIEFGAGPDGDQLPKAGARRIRVCEGVDVPQGSAEAPPNSLEDWMYQASWDIRALLSAAPKVESYSTNLPFKGSKPTPGSRSPTAVICSRPTI